METIAVIDFETTGMSPALGARPTEIGIVLVREGRIIDRYQNLMNAGVRVPWQIQQLTGISNEMVAAAPPIERVMREAADFAGGLPLLAHNASFDSKFWNDEMARLQRSACADFACSLLLSRRLLPEAPNHKLGTLAQFLDLPVTGRHHRALADAEMTGHLLARLQDRLLRRFEVPEPSHALLRALQVTPRHALQPCIDAWLSGIAQNRA